MYRNRFKTSLCFDPIDLTKNHNFIKFASFYIEVRKKRDEPQLPKSCNKTLNSR